MVYGTMYSMFEQFSSGYYLGRLYVQAHDGQRAVLRAREHEHVRQQLYGAETDRQRSTAGREPHPGSELTAPEDRTGSDGGGPPLVMRYGQRHFVVDGDEGIPERTLAVPAEWLPDRPDPLEAREVFLAKADRARQLLRIATGPEQPTGGRSGHDTEGGRTWDAEDGTGRGPDQSWSDGSRTASPFVPDALGKLSWPGSRQ